MNSKQVENPKKKLGAPYRYKEPCVVFQFSVPKSKWELIPGKTQTEKNIAINGMIAMFTEAKHD